MIPKRFFIWSSWDSHEDTESGNSTVHHDDLIIYGHCERILPSWLINTSITSHTDFLCVSENILIPIFIVYDASGSLVLFSGFFFWNNWWFCTSCLGNKYLGQWYHQESGDFHGNSRSFLPPYTLCSHNKAVSAHHPTPGHQVKGKEHPQMPGYLESDGDACISGWAYTADYGGEKRRF